MAEIAVSTLTFEITEMCNLDCHHCLKGESKNIFIKEDVVRKAFKEIKYVDELSFSGGEVMLAYEQMKMILSIAKEENVKVSSCSMLTNGTIYDERIYILLKEYFGDNFIIGISNDDYHDKSIRRIFKDNIDTAIENIKKHYNSDYSSGFKDSENILFDMGRAKNLDKVKHDFEASGYYYDYYNEKMMVGPYVYISALGYLTDGNLEIDAMEQNSLGNILDNTIEELLLSGGIRLDLNNPRKFFNFLRRREYEFHFMYGDHLKFENHKLVSFIPKSLDEYSKALNDAKKTVDEFITSEINEDGSGIKKILEYDFSSYPHDISQVDHK